VGVLPWGTSVWQPIYYRVWQTKSTFVEPRLLLDEKEQADIAAPIYARVSRNDVFIEFHVIAADAMRIPEFLHYFVENRELRHTDPVALTPQSFVSFWLRHPWTEVSEWTAQASRGALRRWHEGYHGTNSEFTAPTRHCAAHRDLWQVATDTGGDLHAGVHYFLIRARPPFRFTMVAASDRPWPDCTEDDTAIDKAPDLFEK